MRKYGILIFVLLLTGCREGKSPLVDMTSAGADIWLSSNTVTGKINVLEKYDSPVVLIQDAVGIKMYPKNGEVHKTTKRYNGKDLIELTTENIYPVPERETKPNNIPYFIFGGVGVLFIFAWTIVKLWRKK